MPYYKWKCYDQGFKYHEGVIQSSDTKTVVKTLESQGFGLRSIEEIDFCEYKRLKAVSDKISIFKNRIQPEKPRETKAPRHPFISFIIPTILKGIIIGIGISLLIALAWLANQQ